MKRETQDAIILPTDFFLYDETDCKNDMEKLAFTVKFHDVVRLCLCWKTIWKSGNCNKYRSKENL